MKTKKLKSKVRLLHFTKLTFLLLFIISLIYVSLISIGTITYNNIVEVDAEVLENPVSILLLGTDSGGEDRDYEDDDYIPRADAIMLLTVNPQNDRGNIEVNVTSIPRDTYTYITCAGYSDKINAAMSHSFDASQDIDTNIEQGSECTKASVEEMFGINIDYYMTADFNSLTTVINEIDGIDINVPYSFCTLDEDGNEDAICLEEGEQTLTGEEALAYARMRKEVNPDKGASGDDWERAIRQQEVVMSTAKKILSTGITNNATTIIEVISNDMWTDLGISDMTGFASIAANMYQLFNDTIQNGNNATFYVKKPYLAQVVYVSPIEDVVGVSLDETDAIDNSTFFGEDSSLSSATEVFKMGYSHLNTNYPTTQYSEDLEPIGIEFQMESLSTYDATDGSSNQLVNDETLSYFSTMLAETLNQELVYDFSNYSYYYEGIYDTEEY